MIHLRRGVSNVEHWGVPKTTVDPTRLYDALDASRAHRNISWRTVASEVGVSPSLLSRLRQGLRPDTNAFAALVDWLGQPAEEFFDREGDAPARDAPALSVRVAPLLRADKNLNNEDVKFLMSVIQAAEQRTRGQRES